jgi:hypothetical protein
LGRGLALGVQGGGSAPARGWGESPILGTELGAEGAGVELRHTSDGRVYCSRGEAGVLRAGDGGYNRLTTLGRGLADVWVDIGVLVAYGAICFAVELRLFKFREA